MEQRWPPEVIGHDGYGPQHPPAPAKPHEISDETGLDRSRRRVGRTGLEPFKLPEAADPFVPGSGIAPQTGFRSHRKSFKQLGVRSVSNSDKKLVSQTVPPMVPSRANKVQTSPAAAALNFRKAALRSTALSRSTTTPRSVTADPVTAVEAVTPPSPIHPALAPVAADSSEAQTADLTSSSTLPRSIEKPRNTWIMNEAASKSNIDPGSTTVTSRPGLGRSD